ncbi:PKD domain-containing protein [Microbacterium sp. ZW T5_56]|uniref:PKD domain-containing protein n=1 Tax=Microbacterium sp. ZW T5_56 TaxID=3378081 RepID=UPI0038554DE3
MTRSLSFARARAYAVAHRRPAVPRLLAVGVVALILITTIIGTSGMSARADDAPPPATVSPVTADPLPTVQINGVVWTQTVVGDWVYAAGQFTSARPAGSARGQNETPRSNLLRYSITTGELDPNFTLSVNGAVNASTASPDGSTVYIGGAFTRVGTETRYRVAAIDVATGALSPLNVGTNATVYGMVATDDALYLTGGFSTVNNVARARVGAVSTTTGSLLPFNAVLSGAGIGRSIVVSPDRAKVVVAGSFERANGLTNPGAGIAALDATTGASLPWAMNSVLRSSGSFAGFMGLSSDESGVYGTAYSQAAMRLEGSFHADWEGGALVAMEDCHGDSYSIVRFRGVVYKASHTHFCGNIEGGFPQESTWFYNHALAYTMDPTTVTILPNRTEAGSYASYSGQPSAKLLPWYPHFTPGTYTGQDQAGWNVTAGGDYVVYGGEFLSVNGSPQQGLVRFGTADVAPNAQGPVIQGAAFKVTITSPKKGQALLKWTSNYDYDDAELTYTVERRDSATSLYTTTSTSSRWSRPALSFRDVALTPRSTYEYRVVVSDPHGNSTRSDWTRVVIAASGAFNVAPTASFTANVDGGMVAVDASASTDSDGRVMSYAWDFGNGVTGTGLALKYWYPASGTYTIRLTVTDDEGKTGVTTRNVTVVVPEAPAMTVIAADEFAGQAVDGWGDASVGGTWTHSGGGSSFSTSDGGLVTLAPSLTRSARLEGVSTMDAITTVRVSSDVAAAGGVTSAAVLGRVVGPDMYSARVRFEPGGTVRLYLLRGETPLGGSSVVLSGYTPGKDVMVALSVRGASPTQLGAKMWFASTVEPVEWQLTATDSTDELQGPGSVGLMGSSSSLSTVPRSVLRFSQYSVHNGRPAVAEGANNPPVAAFTTATDGLRVVVDATGSTDTEAPLARYSWDFGDGTTGEGAVAEHTYVEQGAYPVTLTVTDSDGATDSRERVVSVADAPVGDALAADTFGRDVTDGWGIADTGGEWWTQGGAAAFSVAGGAGRISLAPSWTRAAALSAVQSDAVVVSATVRADAVPEGAGAAALTLIGRQTDTGAYQARVRIEVGGAVRLYVMRDEAALGGANFVLPDKYRPGDPIHVKVQVTGTGETTVAAKMWADGAPEPTAWQLTGTDRTDGLQQMGTVGVRGSMSSGVITPQLTFTVTEFAASSVAQ